MSGAHRLVSLVLVAGMLCLYCPLLRAGYVLFGVKLPEVVLYGILVGFVALAWYGLKAWQFAHLRSAQALVLRSYRRAHITFQGWLAVVLTLASYLVVLLVAIGTIENYTYWP